MNSNTSKAAPAAFTPGPWTTKPAANECVAIYNPAGFHVATTNQECAPLFLAAPDLLAALQAIVDKPWPVTLVPELQAALAALAKVQS